MDRLQGDDMDSPSTDHVRIHRQHDSLRVLTWVWLLCHNCANNSQNSWAPQWLSDGM